MTDAPDDLRLALACSDRAAALALAHFDAGVRVARKPDGSVVTEADGAVERLLRDDLAEGAPNDAILGEELGRTGTGPRTWILDPIDGTAGFARDNPYWRVHVALEVAGRIDVAVVTSPAIGRQWFAARGWGAFESPWPRSTPDHDVRLRVSTTANVAGARLDALRWDRFRLPHEATLTRPHPPAWCTGLIGLLRGDVDGFLADAFQVWDHAPWTLLVEEAGGTFTDLDGTRTTGQGGGLYSNGVLHQLLLAAIPR